MSAPRSAAFVAVDIGNSRMKLGLFEPAAPAQPAGVSPQAARVSRQAARLPAPARTWETTATDLGALCDWLSPLAPEQVAWWIGSVNRPALSKLLEWLGECSRADNVAPDITLLAAGDLPLAVELPRPDMVGIDRLLNAVAANRLRPAARGAIVVDLGSAITVDRISAQGAFLGGAILPGIGTSARALHEFTDLLPLLDMQSLAEPPVPLGKDTAQAIRAGLYWGAVGGARELIARLSAGEPEPPQVFLTGGAAPSVASLLAPTAEYVPHLTLGGIAAVATKENQNQKS